MNNRLFLEHFRKDLFLNSDGVAEKLRFCCEVMVNVCVCERSLFSDGEEAAITSALIFKIFTKGEIHQR